MEDYSKKDFPSTYEDLLSMVKSSTNLWNPSNSTEADPGVVILKLMAFLEDRAGYRFDMAHAQNYLDSVSDRQSAQELLQMLGYTMQHARAATGEIRLQVIDTSNYNDIPSGQAVITVPIFSLITDRTKSIKFFTTSQLTITKETMNNVSVVAVQAGEPFQVVKDGVAYYTLKDVDEQGRLYLGKSNLAQNGIYVFSDYDITGEQLTDRASHKWTYVDFSILKPRGNFYTVGEGENGEMYVQFPDNFEDLLTGQYIEVWATYTEGAASNITANTLALFDESAVFDGVKNLTVAQPNDIYTGQDAETIADASKHYYAEKDICNTLVTAQDFATAIRYLVNFDGKEIDGTLPGQRFFSNAVTKTAQSRRLPVRTKAYDKEYTLYEKVDNQTPCNQIDVVGLQYSSSYPDSFKLRQVSTGIEAEFENQLQDNHALDVDIVDATDASANGSKIDRILAVTTPNMIIRISRNATITDLALKQKIRDYFYSKYRADNIEFGKELDYQTIVDDIRALDPSINSVSMQELDYTLYKKYAPVDGVTSVPLSQDDKNLAVAKSVLAGIIPLYKFYNRQNTPSKQNVLYSMSSSTSSSSGTAGQGESAADQVLALPFGADYYYKLTSTSPKVSNAIFCSSSAISGMRGSAPYPVPIVSRNQLLQFRRPVTQSTANYGYGMQYVFTRYYPIEKQITASADSVLGDGTILAKGSKIVTRNGLTLPTYLWQVDEETNPNPPCKEDGTVIADSLTLQGKTEVGAGTILAKNSALAPGSKFVESAENTIEFNPASVPADSTYMLQKGETLKIFTSTGELKETFVKGGKVKTSGFSLVNQPNPKTLTSLSTVESISREVDKTSDIGIEFKYLLSLRNKVQGDELTLDKDGYMLEEGEFFIYADKAISEYVILGAGTVLKPATGVSDKLHVSYVSAVEEVTKDSGFRDVPFAITGAVYEFQNFRYPCTAMFSSESDTGSSESASIHISSSWEALTNTCRIYKSSTYTERNTDQEILSKLSDYRDFVTDCYGKDSDYSKEENLVIILTRDEGWEQRRVLLLETDEDNVCFVSAPCDLSIEGEGGKKDSLLFPSSTVSSDRIIAGILSASSSFSTVLFGDDSDTAEGNGGLSLLPEGVAMSFSRASKLALPAPQSLTTVESKAGSLQLNYDVANLTEANSLSIPIALPKEGGSLSFSKLLFSFTVSENITSGTVTIEVKDSASSDRKMYIASLLRASSGQESKIEFSCAKGVDNRTGEVFEVTSPSWSTLESPVIIVSVSGLKQGEKSEGTASVLLSDLSYVTGPSGESGFQGSVETIEADIKKIYNGGRFNWLYTPTEDFVDPTSAASFFNEMHPYNYCTIPYINFDAASIKIIRER